MKVTGEKILTWTAIAGIVIGVVTFYIRVKDTVEMAPKTAAEVANIQKWREVQDERWETMEWWMAGVGKKLGVPAPPQGRRRRVRGP